MKKLVAAAVTACGLLAMALPAQAAAPAPRAFTASFRTYFDKADVLLVKVYAADHRSGITYTCTDPVETTTSTGATYSELWASRGLCAASRGERRAISAKYVLGATDALYVYTPGFAPAPRTTYRYKCYPLTESSTFTSSYVIEAYAAQRACPVG